MCFGVIESDVTRSPPGSYGRWWGGVGSLASILSSATSSRVTRSELTTDPAFLMRLFSLLACHPLHTPQCLCHQRISADEVLEVCSVGGEEEGRQHSSLGGGAPMLQSVRQTVIEPCDKRRMHLHVLQFGLQQPGLDGVEGAGGAEEHGAGVKSVENRLSTVHFPQLLLQRFSGSRLHLSPHSIRPWCRCSPVCVPVFSCSCPYSP